MSKLNLGLEIRDFDLERMGFSLSVLDSAKGRQHSEAYLRMTLKELGAFVNALKAAREDVDISTYEPPAARKLPIARPLEPSGDAEYGEGEDELPASVPGKVAVGRGRG